MKGVWKIAFLILIIVTILIFTLIAGWDDIKFYVLLRGVEKRQPGWLWVSDLSLKEEELLLNYFTSDRFKKRITDYLYSEFTSPKKIKTQAVLALRYCEKLNRDELLNLLEKYLTSNQAVLKHFVAEIIVKLREKDKLSLISENRRVEFTGLLEQLNGDLRKLRVQAEKNKNMENKLDDISIFITVVEKAIRYLTQEKF